MDTTYKDIAVFCIGAFVVIVTIGIFSAFGKQLVHECLRQQAHRTAIEAAALCRGIK
jgi:short subunit dehydrogenase-like uncharacterized protein